jgi:hypothetical protein
VEGWGYGIGMLVAKAETLHVIMQVAFNLWASQCKQRGWEKDGTRWQLYNGAMFST